MTTPANDFRADSSVQTGPDHPGPGFDDLYAVVDGTAPDSDPPDGSGNRTGILLLHGWGSNAALMRPLAVPLAGLGETHCVDLPGHGHSPVPPRALDIGDHARLVADYIRHRMPAPPIIAIGHSNGGRILLFMAAQPEYRALFDKLILVSPSGITPERGARYYVKRTIARTLRAPARLLPPRAADFFNDWITHSLAWRALGSSDYNAVTGVMRETFVNALNLLVDDIVERIECPVLVFRGDRDTAVSLRQMRTLTERIPGAGLVELEGAGHYGHLDATDAVVAACRAFIVGSTATVRDSPASSAAIPPRAAPGASAAHG